MTLRRWIPLVSAFALAMALAACRNDDAGTAARTAGTTDGGGAAQHLALANRYLALAGGDASLKEAGRELIESGKELTATKAAGAAQSLSAAGRSLSTANAALSPATSISPAAGRNGQTGNSLSPAEKPLPGQVKASSPEEYLRLAQRELAAAAAKLDAGAGTAAAKTLSPPSRLLSASGLSLSASGRSVSAADRALSPAGKSLSQGGRAISPAAPVPISRERYIALARRHVQIAAQALAQERGDKTLSPAKTSLSPAGKSLQEAGKTLSATDKALSPAGKRLVQTGKTLSATGGALSPKPEDVKGAAVAARHVGLAHGLIAAASSAPSFSAVEKTLSPRQLLGDSTDTRAAARPAGK